MYTYFPGLHMSLNTDKVIEVLSPSNEKPLNGKTHKKSPAKLAGQKGLIKAPNDRNRKILACGLGAVLKN